jgi:hypothetical protein
MKFSNCHQRRSFLQRLALSAAVLGFLVDCFALPARADPASTIQTLMIVDQGNFLTFQWSFYYVDFPPHFVLKEKQSQPVSLDNASTIYENLSDIVSVAFDLKINGQSIPPDKISRLTISPSKLCTVTMIYRGYPGGHLELRAPVLQYLPSIAIINYEILSLGHTNRVVTGNLTAQKGPFSQSIVYEQVGANGPFMPEFESAPFALFKSQLRTAWINSNWIFIGLILLLVLKSSKAASVLAIMTLGWIVLGLLDLVGDIKIPWPVPGFVLALPTALLGVMAAKFPAKRLWLVIIAGGAGLLNALNDLQQIRWTAEDQTILAFTGLSLGFVCSILSVGVVQFVLLVECRKYAGFETDWVPNICWLVAGLAILLPLQKFFFS